MDWLIFVFSFLPNYWSYKNDNGQSIWWYQIPLNWRKIDSQSPLILLLPRERKSYCIIAHSRFQACDRYYMESKKGLFHTSNFGSIECISNNIMKLVISLSIAWIATKIRRLKRALSIFGRYSLFSCFNRKMDFYEIASPSPFPVKMIFCNIKEIVMNLSCCDHSFEVSMNSIHIYCSIFGSTLQIFKHWPSHLNEIYSFPL